MYSQSARAFIGKGEMRTAILTFAVAAVAAQTSPPPPAPTINYATMLTALFQQTDVTKDGALSFLEFTDAAGKLGIKPEILTLHGQSYQQFFTAVDADGSGTLTKEEFAYVVLPPSNTTLRFTRPDTESSILRSPTSCRLSRFAARRFGQTGVCTRSP